MCSNPTTPSHNKASAFTEYLEAMEAIQGIPSQFHSISEHLNLLDHEISEQLEEQLGLNFITEPFQPELRASITRGDLETVARIVDSAPYCVDAETLCLAIRYYKPAVFHELLQRCPFPDDDHVLAEPLYCAAKAGRIDAVRLLLGYGANPHGDDPCIHATPLAGAASGGHLDIVQHLVEKKGTDINGNGKRSPLSRALKHHRRDVIDYLVKSDADVQNISSLEHLDIADILRGFKPQLNPPVLHRMLSLAAVPKGVNSITTVQDDVTLSAFARLVNSAIPQTGMEIEPAERFLESIQDYWWSENPADFDADLLAQERRLTMRRLLAKLRSLLGKLRGAILLKAASHDLKRFVCSTVGNSLSVLRDGIRTIRNVIGGFKPPSLYYVVCTLLVGSAMRSVVPPSSLRCSKEEFLDGIRPWADLVKAADRCLFYEIASCLWGFSSSTAPKKSADALDDAVPITILRELVNHLVATSDLVDRRQYGSGTRGTNADERDIPLAEWDPLPKLGAEEDLDIYTLGLTDQGARLKTLARITVLMAGSTFSSILLYLCLWQYGFSTRLPISVSNIRECRSPNKIVTRNCVIVAKYMSCPSPHGSGRLGGTKQLTPESNMLPHVPPDSPLADRNQKQTADFHSPCVKNECKTICSPGAVDVPMEDAPADSSPNHPSQSKSLPKATVLTYSNTKVRLPGYVSVLLNETVVCEINNCYSMFKLGEKGREGQSSNFTYHRKKHHPETTPDCVRIIYVCSDCEKEVLTKSNIKVHRAQCLKKNKQQSELQGQRQ